MTTFLCTISFEHDTGLPEDDVVNTWHFEGPSIPTPNTANIMDMVEDFYTVTYAPSIDPLLFYYSGSLNGNYRLRVYDVDAAPPRAPIATRTGVFGPVAGGGPLPEEVALVNSFYAAPVAGTPAARRRNRNYLGPFNRGALGVGDGRPVPALLQVVKNAAVGMKAASDASLDMKWVILSATTGVTANVVGGWVDNAWDTQRRRGTEADLRISW